MPTARIFYDDQDSMIRILDSRDEEGANVFPFHSVIAFLTDLY